MLSALLQVALPYCCCRWPFPIAAAGGPSVPPRWLWLLSPVFCTVFPVAGFSVPGRAARCCSSPNVCWQAGRPSVDLFAERLLPIFRAARIFRRGIPTLPGASLMVALHGDFGTVGCFVVRFVAGAFPAGGFPCSPCRHSRSRRPPGWPRRGSACSARTRRCGCARSQGGDGHGLAK